MSQGFRWWRPEDGETEADAQETSPGRYLLNEPVTKARMAEVIADVLYRESSSAPTSSTLAVQEIEGDDWGEAEVFEVAGYMEFYAQPRKSKGGGS